MTPKKQSLLALATILLTLPAYALLANVLPSSLSALAGLSALLIAIGFYIGARISCPTCRGRIISLMRRPAGAMPFLWATKESPSGCERDLPFTDGVLPNAVGLPKGKSLRFIGLFVF